MKNVGLVVIVLVLKFGDHRRWSEPAHVAARPASIGGPIWPKIIIFDYGHVGVCFGRFYRNLGIYMIVYRSVTE